MRVADLRVFFIRSREGGFLMDVDGNQVGVCNDKSETERERIMKSNRYLDQDDRLLPMESTDDLADNQISAEQRAAMFEQLIGGEDDTFRDEHTKHFHLGGHRYQAVVFPEPVHYRGAANEPWREIDNNLEETVNEQGREVFRNRASNLLVELAKQAGNGALVKLTHNGDTLEWTLDATKQNSYAKIKTGKQLRQDMLLHLAQRRAALSGKALTAKECEPDVLEVMMTPQDRRADIMHRHAQASYEGLVPGLTMRYTLSGTQIKEDIILADRKALKHAVLRLPDRYEYWLRQDQSVSVRKDGEEVFAFQPPYVYDAEGKGTRGTVELSEGDGFVRMRYRVSEAFLREAVYPITIDPVVHTSTSSDNIDDTYLRRADPTSNFGRSGILRVGFNNEENITLFKVRKLIKQRASDTILFAGVRLRTAAYGSEVEYTGVYQILYNWNEVKATWNKPAVDASGAALAMPVDQFIDTELLDYQKSTIGGCIWDVTNLYKSWYKLTAGQSTNFGVAIRKPKGITEGEEYVEFRAREYNYDRPSFIVNYISHAGLEGWWQYESLSAGRAGTMNVDIYNGNMVLAHPDTAMNGNRMPVSVTHYYNSCLSSADDVHCGMGWRTSAHQSVYRKTISDIDYMIWTDGDGTEHYFQLTEKTSPYEDEEGMSLKLRLQTDTMTITDKANNVMTFPRGDAATKRYIMQIADPQENLITYRYDASDPTKLLGVMDGTRKRETAFAYDGSEMLSSITAPGCPVITFGYTGQLLTSVRYGDLSSSQYTQYGYETGTNMLISATNYDGLNLALTYEDPTDFDAAAIEDFTAQARRVTSMELSNGSMDGSRLLFAYQDQQTDVTVVKAGDTDGKVLSYQFNDSGNVICVKDELGYAQFTKYAGSPTNSPSQVSRLQKVVINRLLGIQLKSQWTFSKTATSDTGTWDGTNRCLGLGGVKIVKTGAGEALYRQSVTLEASKDWSFSAYVRIDSALTGGNAFLRLKYGSTVMTSVELNASTLQVSGGPSADGWERLHLAVQNVPAGTVTVEMVCDASAGTVWFAAPQLEEGAVANNVNQFENADFRLTKNNTEGSQVRQFPMYWTPSGGVSTSMSNGIVAPTGFPSALGGQALQMLSTPTRSAVAFNQVLDAVGKKNDVLVIGGWASGMPVANKDAYIGFSIDFYSSGAFGNRKRVDFNREWVGWQYGCFPIVAPVNYTQIRVYVTYSYNANTAQFSNLFLYKEGFGRSYAYDSKKNVTAVTTLAGQQSDKKYDDADNLKSYRQPGAPEGDLYKFNYGATATEQKKHLLLDTTTPMGVRNYFTYDAYGNQEGMTIGKSNDGANPIIDAFKHYDQDGNYIASTIDARGNEATQLVDPTKGTLTWAQGPDGQRVDYTYDPSKRVSSMQTIADGKTYRNEYTYQDDRLRTVGHNTITETPDVTYTFEYDPLGAQKRVLVGSQPLSTDTYSVERSHNLLQTDFGNGGQIAYDYDDFDRMIAVRCDGESAPRYQYQYGANGKAACVLDNNLARVTQIEYDQANRLCQMTTRDMSLNLIYRATLLYDKMNRLGIFRQTAGGYKMETLYGYDKDNRPAPEKDTGGTITRHAVQYGQLADNRYVDYSYDALGRITGRTQMNGTYTSAATYTFVPGNNVTPNTTTPLVESIAQPGLNLTYTYDNEGNILTETRNGQTTRYQYDMIGQLLRVDDPNEPATWTFEYDMGGNMLSKKKYNYTTEATPPGTPTVYAYTYDATWKDKLASFAGKSIVYDAIGNPTSYDGWTYTWIAGRKLSKMSMTGKTVEFAYDANGLRIQKKVTDGATVTTTDYSMHGKLLMHLKQEVSGVESNICFSYDAHSRPSMIRYNESFYTYVLNLQGDIVAIVDANGLEVVQYKYDAWGRLVSTSGSLATTLGKLNPFRYKGYVYDEETACYYLKNRYYSPDFCRFLNEDSILSQGLLAQNTFGYCMNNPVSYSDPSGTQTGTVLRPVPEVPAEAKPLFIDANEPLPDSTFVGMTGSNGIYEISFSSNKFQYELTAPFGRSASVFESSNITYQFFVGIPDKFGDKYDRFSMNADAAVDAFTSPQPPNPWVAGAQAAVEAADAVRFVLEKLFSDFLPRKDYSSNPITRLISKKEETRKTIINNNGTRSLDYELHWFDWWRWI